MNGWRLDIGASVMDEGKVRFRVWAPKAEKLSVELMRDNGNELLALRRDDTGYFETVAENIFAGGKYFYLLNNIERYPDPASRFQPEGVHGPSQIIDPRSFKWTDNGWKGTSLKDYIIYELHVGAFTKEGTFEAINPYLDYLKGLGVTAIELMPVSQFPGARNWGYDGACPFGVQNSYGGPDGLKTLVNECHANGLAIILDIVCNHLGPEGNYTNKFGHYFTDRYKTPWGDAVNFDGAFSDEVRKYFIDNALYWITEYHMDALRIDAIHGIYDFNAKNFLLEMAEAVHTQAEALGRRIYVIAESDLNDVRVINSVAIGGYGLDAQWNDDFHHCLHALLTGEKTGYYEDFGEIQRLEKAFREGFVYSGEYSKYRRRRHGSSSKDRPAHQFIVFSQNHDQVGNRATGDRSGLTQSFEKLKLAAGAVILSPYIPLIFMGEEYGETAPFQYFISHSDEHLIEAVRKGRREEFASFGWKEALPDPQDEQSFLNSKINMNLHREGRHNVLFKFYREMIRLRKEVPALSNLSKNDMEVKVFEGNTAPPPPGIESYRLDRGESEKKVLFVRRWLEKDQIFCLYNFAERNAIIRMMLPVGVWERTLDSSSDEWGGDGEVSVQKVESRAAEVTFNMKSHSFVLYRLQRGGI